MMVHAERDAIALVVDDVGISMEIDGNTVRNITLSYEKPHITFYAEFNSGSIGRDKEDDRIVIDLYGDRGCDDASIRDDERGTIARALESFWPNLGRHQPSIIPSDSAAPAPNTIPTDSPPATR